MADLLRDARERLLCKGNDCETTCPRYILSFDLRYRSRDLYKAQGAGSPYACLALPA